MGCVNCSIPLSTSTRPRHLPNRSTPITGLIEESSRRSLRINKANYVKIKEGSLADVYEIGAKIGEGAHGSVFKAVHRRLNQPRAIKMIARTRWSKKIQKQFVSEVHTLREMDHPNILKVYEVIKDSRHYHIVTELLRGGELLDKILSGEKCTEVMVAGYMQQILSAVSYCHDHNIIHRDLKPENLVFESEEEGALLKVIDFGASCGITEELKDLAGTDFYLAPEILMKKNYDEKCDIWSCGVILYVLLCGYPPFNGSSIAKIHQRILEQPLGFPLQEWKSVSREAKDMIRLMLNKDPTERPSAHTLLNHPWLLSMADKSPKNAVLECRALTNLKDFQAGTKLRQAALHLISNQIIKPETFQEMRLIFMSLDMDRDGRLSREELRQGFELAQMENTDLVDKVMATCDADHSGFIEFSEFLTATVNWAQVLDRKTVETAFAVFDEDCDGKLSSSELRNAISGNEGSIDEDAWREVLQEADISVEDGISFSEFEKLIIKRSKSFAELPTVQPL